MSNAAATEAAIIEKRKRLDEERKEIAQEKNALRILRATLEAGLARVLAWLCRVDLPPEASIEGDNLLMDVTQDLPPEQDDDRPGM